MPVRLQLFGSPKIDCDGASFALAFERRNQVLVLAALKRSWVGRAELAAMLWPDQPGKLAYSNVRKTLFRLKSLPWAEHIELQGSAVRFDARTDVFDFETALREQRLADALPMHAGDLLQGFDDDRSEAWSSWLNFERERLRGAWRAAALERLGGDIDPAEGIDLSARLLEADPLDEAALRGYMLWLSRGGQAMAARKAYRDFSERLSKELGLAPGAETAALHDSLGARAREPAHAEAHDDFVGRAVERRKVAELLAQPGCRLLVIVGPGGMGKTRLARRTLQDLAPAYSHGAAFVSLEDVSAPDEFGGRLARELGLSLAGSAQPMDQVNEFLRDRHLLLVLDNLDDFAAHASLLERLLQSCPRLKILATSRVRLGTASEWSLPLEGLPFPERDDLDRAEAFDAVQLFVAAARRVDPSLNAASEAAAIADVCRRVEGVPLAIELAAGWTRVLSCEAIAAELRRGTELLRAVDATRDSRHASIEVVFEQSWRHLSAVERETLARLSVFRGGFTVEAARAAANASLPVLGALIDKSLIRKEGTRNVLHSLIHQLTRARLQGEARALSEAAHAAYFHRLMAQQRRAVETGDREALQRIDTEAENCRAAWRWSVEHGQSEALARSALTVLNFCDHRGRFAQGLALLRDALAAKPANADARYEPLLLSAVAHLEYRLDRYAEAEAAATRALAGTRPTADHDTRLQCFKVLGGVNLRLGKLDEAKRFFRQALQQSPGASDPHNAAAMLDNLALVEKNLGHYDEARRMSMESLVQHRLLADVAGEALCLNNLGDLEMVVGDLETASTHFAASLALCDRHGLVNTRGYVLANLTEIALTRGDANLAEERGLRALEVARESGNRAVECWVRMYFARIALHRNDVNAARDELRAALELAAAIGRPTLQKACVACAADVLEKQGDGGAARALRDAIPAGREPLAELVRRLIVETPLAYAPLVESLRVVQ